MRCPAEKKPRVVFGTGEIGKKGTGEQGYRRTWKEGKKGTSECGNRRTRERGKEEQGNRGTREQGNGGTREHGNRGTREQGNKGTSERGNRGTRGQRDRGNKGNGELGNKRTEEQGNKRTGYTCGEDERTDVRSRDYQSLPKFLVCNDNQVFLLVLLRCARELRFITQWLLQKGLRKTRLKHYFFGRSRVTSEKVFLFFRTKYSKRKFEFYFYKAVSFIPSRSFFR